MNQPLDNFFREKLGQAHKPAPPAAWDRIDAGLHGRQRKGLWLKVAASVLVVAAGTFILWPAEDTTGSAPLAEAPVKNTTPQHTVPQQTAPTPVVVAPAPAVAHTPQAQPASKKQPRRAPRQTTPAVAQPLPVQQNVAVVQPEAQQQDQHNHDANGYEPTAPLRPAPASSNVALAEADMDEEKNDESITLVYTANEIDEKYLDKEALAKATSAQKKPSTFRKLLDKAYDLKNNSDPMGGLRQKKDEILALNFKSEKRSQNK
jgi:hypothetical protein